MDLSNNNGTGKVDTGSDHCSRYSLCKKAERKVSYKCRELTLIPVSLSKYFTLVGTNFIESALAERALAIAGQHQLICGKVAQLDRPCQLKRNS
ncbi:hypothetical protein [Microcoleus sp. T3_A4]|uniref:hypothetical protein n=1 Tax=Microcoleus sp. T3_A4 TaxID=2818968 RepID=UPI002FD43B42